MAPESFPKWRAGIRALIQGGLWRWALAVGFAVALGTGVWVYDVFGPEIRASWPRWKTESAPWVGQTLLWIEFLASITLTCALLCWFTAFFFCLLCAILFGLPRLLGKLSRHLTADQRLARIHRSAEAVVQRDRLVGTVLNLLAGVAALYTLMVALRRPLDYWDVGIQTAISAAVELIVLQVLFSNGPFGWPTNKVS